MALLRPAVVGLLTVPVAVGKDLRKNILRSSKDFLCSSPIVSVEQKRKVKEIRRSTPPTHLWTGDGMVPPAPEVSIVGKVDQRTSAEVGHPKDALILAN